MHVRGTGSSRDALVMILAGGRGDRLRPLTEDRAKGAVPFGGQYRLIDFTLSNCVNSGLRRITILTQYKSSSLERHLRQAWNFLRPEFGESLDVLPPQHRVNREWYQGTANAVFHNLYTLERELPKHTLILSSDHVYHMDYESLLQYHESSGAALTVPCLGVPLSQARRFGVVRVDPTHRLIDFQEKPARPTPSPFDAERALASMGIYVFDTDVLREVIHADAERPDSNHDFGGDVLPAMVSEGTHVQAYDAAMQSDLRPFFWRDIGEIDAYWESSMELLGPEPAFNLSTRNWPLHSWRPAASPVGVSGGRARILDSLICPGANVNDAEIERSILSPGVVVEGGASVGESILMDNVHVGAGAKISRSIIDKDVRVPAGAHIGVDSMCGPYMHVSPGGIVTVPKGCDLSTLPAGPNEPTMTEDQLEAARVLLDAQLARPSPITA